MASLGRLEDRESGVKEEKTEAKQKTPANIVGRHSLTDEQEVIRKSLQCSLECVKSVQHELQTTNVC